MKESGKNFNIHKLLDDPMIHSYIVIHTYCSFRAIAIVIVHYVVHIFTYRHSLDHWLTATHMAPREIFNILVNL